MEQRSKTIWRSLITCAAHATAVLLMGRVQGGVAAAGPLAFPGAVGQGAAATGGRGGDVYRVTSLEDYDPDREEKIPGTLRHAIRSAESPRTIVFDVSGGIQLHAPLEILKSRLTLAGQTSPGGVTVWGYPTEISRGSDVIVRYLRFRLGDFNARRPAEGAASATPGNNDMDPGSANALNIGDGGQRVILDHVSASWSIDETLSVTRCRDVTVQHSIVAESLNHSLHPKGDHGYGTLIRGELTPDDQAAGVGGFTFYGNLWARNRARNPSIGGQQRLEPGEPEAKRRRTDVNIVNNVIYGWGDQATHRSELGDVRINLIGNYYIAGPAKAAKYFFRANTPGRTQLYQHDNWQDLDRDGEHDGRVVESPADVAAAFQGFSGADELVGAGRGADDGTGAAEPFDFLGALAEDIQPASQAYLCVVKSVGASLWRDAVDARVIETLARREGNLVDSQEEFRGADGQLPGIDDLTQTRRPAGFDVDNDGMADDFERAEGLDPADPADGNRTDLSPEGYTNLEVYLNRLAAGGKR